MINIDRIEETEKTKIDNSSTTITETCELLNLRCDIRRNAGTHLHQLIINLSRLPNY